LMENNKEGLTISERVLLAENTIAELVKDKKELRSDFEVYIASHSLEHKIIDTSFHKQDLQNIDTLNKISEVLGKITTHIEIHNKDYSDKGRLGKKIREWTMFIIIVIGALVGTISWINYTINKVNHVEPVKTELNKGVK